MVKETKSDTIGENNGSLAGQREAGVKEALPHLFLVFKFSDSI